jgi:hypothetical protein
MRPFSGFRSNPLASARSHLFASPPAFLPQGMNRPSLQLRWPPPTIAVRFSHGEALLRQSRMVGSEGTSPRGLAPLTFSIQMGGPGQSPTHREPSLEACSSVSSGFDRGMTLGLRVRCFATQRVLLCKGPGPKEPNPLALAYAMQRSRAHLLASQSASA